MSPSEFDRQAPVVVSGVGGSGTRVVTEMLIRLGYHMGASNNSAHDNIWFRYLIKRPDWYRRCLEGDRGELARVFDLFTDIMTGSFTPSAASLGPAWKATREQGWRGIKRLVRLLRVQPPTGDAFTGWGWKEPSAHIYLDVLHQHFPRMKYIHTIRHGLDMAFTGKLSQIRDWASFFELPDAPSDEELPRVLLEFWIRANRRAISLGSTLGPSQFYLLDFEKLCRNPQAETRRLVLFLGIDPAPEKLQEAAAVPRPPSSQKRYLAHNLRGFSPEQLDAVREFGFVIEGKGP